MRSSIDRSLVMGFLCACSMVTSPWSNGFQKLEGPQGAASTWFTSSAGSQFLGTYSGVYRRHGNTGAWTKAFGSTYGIQVLLRGDTMVIHEDAPLVSVDAGSSWSSFSLPDYLRRLLSVGPYGLVASVGADWTLCRSMDLGKSWVSLNIQGVEGAVEWGGGWVLQRFEGIRFLDAATGIDTPMVEGLSENGTYTLSSDGTVLFASQFMGDMFRFDSDKKSWVTVGIRWARDGAIFRGDTVYQGADSVLWADGDSPDKYRWYRSLDKGVNWNLEKVFPAASRIQGLVPAGQDLMALVPGHGIAKVGAGTDLIPDNEGLRDSYLRDLVISGSDMYAHMLISGWIFHSQDLGLNWTFMARSRVGAGPTSLFTVGKEVFLQDPAYFGRWRASGSVFDSIASPPFEQVTRMKEGGDGFYAYATRAEPIYSESGRIHGYRTLGILASSPKNPITWSTLPLPKAHFTGWDADGRLILGTDDSTLAWSRDGGRTWIGLSGLPFSRPNAVRFTRGNWYVSSEKGLFRSADPEGGVWSPTSLASQAGLVAASGDRLLVRGGDKVYHISPDLGATWLTILNPMPNADTRTALMSDSLLCLSGPPRMGNVTEWHCSDLENLPVPVRKADKLARPRAGAGYFRGRWRIMQPPARIGEPPRYVDPQGRVLPEPDPHP